MENYELIQELRERLIKIETILESKFNISDLKAKELEGRIDKLESTQMWLWRAIGGGIIGAVLALILKTK